jgi:predicted aminopeptidase
MTCWIFRAATGAAVVALVAACSTVGFYTQAIVGQGEILQKSRPFAEVRTDSRVSEQVKAKLSVVDDIRFFAESELGLKTKRQYDQYADLGREHVVWVVFATPELSLEARSWHYPMVGELKYRGYFREKNARKLADGLRADGDDVYLAGVDAYSTLGFFRDPILNTFVDRHDAYLAELLFHELTHQRVYFSGDTDFNEALATTVGEEGARRWLRQRGRLRELAAYDRETRLVREFIGLAMSVREELDGVYQTEGLNDAIKRERKKAILTGFEERAMAMKKRQGGSLKIEKWFEQPVNNARLNSIDTYYQLVPAFERLLASCGGEMEPFFEKVEAMGKLSRDERRERLGVD